MFTLVNSALLGMVALAGIPLLVHLFARARPPVFAFSSIEFLRKIVRTTTRVRKPRDILLLVLRTLAVLCLVLAFLRPLLFSDNRLSGAGERKNVVLVVDATASMAFVDGAQSRFAAACAKGAEVIADLGANDRANVVWIKAKPEPVFPGLGTGHAFLADSLRKARVTGEPADIRGALAIAAAQLEDAEGGREVWVLSDFQATQWRDFPLVAPEGISLVTVPVGGDEAPNMALARLDCDPPHALAGEEASILCEVRNFSSQPRGGTLYLEAGEVRQSQEVLIAPWSSATAIFRCRFGAAGHIAVRAALDEDSFPSDDRRVTVLDVRESLDVGLLTGDDPQTAAVWRDALDAFGWARVREIDEGDIGSSDGFDLLLLAGWNGEAAAAVRDASRKGTTVVAIPATGAPLSIFGGAEDALFVERRPADGVALTIAAPDDALFRLFRSGEYDDPTRGSFRRYHAFERGLLPDGGSATLLAYGDADMTPALVRWQPAGSGGLFLWNLPLGSDAGDWGTRPGFLTLFGELIHSSRASAPGTRIVRQSTTGAGGITWESDRDLLPSEISLVDEAGNAQAFEAVTGTGTGTVLVSRESPPPGLYRWTTGSTTLGFGAVNAPETESDLRALSADAIVPATAIVLDARQPLARLREGSPLWPWLLGLAAGFLLIEGIFTAIPIGARNP